jgi:hypothetical protein
MHNNNFLDNIFSPLGPQYCNYFYYLTVFFFSMFVFTAVVVLKSVFMDKKKMKISNIMIILTQPLLLYFVNRLYYSMCVGSLR